MSHGHPNGRVKMKLRIAIALAACLVASWARADQTIRVDGSAGGERFDGAGAVSGGGATSVLLKDYPEPQRSQILDLLFKPKFGASMSTLYVEIPGDGNSTQGTEPSHMHRRDDENYSRGYEWWLMREAKRRNPAITLDACPWSCPGWVGNGQFWSQDLCDYDVKWIQGLKRVYGLNLDAIGCRNERGSVESFVTMFRRTLNDNGLSAVKIHAFDGNGDSKWDWCEDLATNAALRGAVDIISNHTMSTLPTPAAVKELAERLGKPIWNTEEHVYTDQDHTYDNHFDCAIGYVHQFNDNYIISGVTKVVYWYLVGSMYSVEPYAEQPAAMMADSPWSGHYDIKPALWAYAHIGQFSDVGWTYLNGACGKLAGGGTYVTLKSPGNDYSIILETGGAAADQKLRMEIAGGLSNGTLCVWRTNRAEQFARQPDIQPAGGTFTITVEPDSIYSISTTRGQQKGSFPEVPPAKPFPFPYHENFDHYSDPKSWGYLPHYTADICGVFELAPPPTAKAIVCVRSWMPRPKVGRPNGCPTPSWAMNTGRTMRSAPTYSSTTAGGPASWGGSTAPATDGTAIQTDTTCAFTPTAAAPCTSPISKSRAAESTNSPLAARVTGDGIDGTTSGSSSRVQKFPDLSTAWKFSGPKTAVSARASPASLPPAKATDAPPRCSTI